MSEMYINTTVFSMYIFRLVNYNKFNYWGSMPVCFVKIHKRIRSLLTTAGQDHWFFSFSETEGR